MPASRNEMRTRRHQRVRRTVNGTSERPRLNVFRSLEHIYAQIVDDTDGRTLVSASTIDKSLIALSVFCQKKKVKVLEFSSFWPLLLGNISSVCFHSYYWFYAFFKGLFIKFDYSVHCSVVSYCNRIHT